MGKVALVTGASSGIGAAIAERLASEGAAVAVNYSGGKERAEKIVAGITERGGRAVALRASVAEPSQIRRLFDETEKQLGAIDILAANAGTSGKFAPLVELTEEDFDKVFALNTRGLFFCLQEAAKRFREGGRIVCTSSAVTRAPMAGASAYGATKAAVEIFVQVLAKELGPRGITVNAVAPGPTDTPLLKTGDEEMVGKLKAATPLGRLGAPEDVADVVAFLASEQARWITGQIIYVAGGMV